VVDWLRTGGGGERPASAGAITTPGAPPTVTQTGPSPDQTSDGARQIVGAFQRQEESRTGQLVGGKYQLGQRLGAGGMGVVYEATNTWTGRQVALKLMHPWFSAEPQTVSRFRREAQSATRIKHPSIVDVLDMGEDARDGALFIVQEFLTGDTLRQHLVEHGPLPVLEAVALLEPIMEGLAAAHDAGVVHRDVKPENVILSVAHGGVTAPKLIDFGVSKITAGDHAGVLQTDRVLGTPAYMSPEQLRADETIDGRTDVWAIGAVLYEMLSGRRPFAAESRGQVWVQILTVDPAPLRDACPEVPSAVAQVVSRALARERESRWPTMRAMLSALRESLSADGTLNTTGAGLGQLALAPLAETKSPPTPPRHTRPLWWTLAGVATLAVIFAAILISSRTKAPITTTPSPHTLPPPTPPPPTVVAPALAPSVTPPPTTPPIERRPTTKRHRAPPPPPAQPTPNPPPKHHLILDP
jgi:serine/threonine-protein kinase